MASFADKIPTFNPYVQQLPVEAMVQVGMEKQKRYDEGVQKIQGEIDRIGGLDVVRDVDKAYLQSKINDLGSSLKTFMASDFSDYQLVNSVAGMTSNIAKDNKVLGAVSATSQYRKQKELMEKAIQEGKSGEPNVYAFQQSTASWLNDDTPGASFNGRYTPYRDVRKKAIEAIKGLHPKLQEVDIPYVVRGDGSIDTTRLADVLTKQKIEGIDENQIRQAIYSSLDEDDWNQLQLDANYKFRGIDSENLVNTAKLNYDKQRKDAIENLTSVNISLGITKDPVQIEKLKAQKEAYEALLGKDGKDGELDRQFLDNVELARKNPDAAKYNIYKDAFVSEFANAFSYANKTSTIHANPYLDAEHWRLDFAFKQARAQAEDRFKMMNYDLEVKKLAQSVLANQLKQQELNGVAPSWQNLTIDTTNKENYEKVYNSYVSSLSDSVDSLYNAAQKAGFSKSEIDAGIVALRNSGGDNSKGVVNSKLYSYLAGENGLIKKLDEKGAFLKKQEQLKLESEKQAGVDVKINTLLKNRGNTTFTLPSGEKVVLSPREMLDLHISLSKKTPIEKDGPSKGSIEQPIDDNYSGTDLNKLNANQKKIVSLLSNPNYKNYVSSIEKQIKSFSNVSLEYRELKQKANDIYLKKLGDIANYVLPRIKGAPLDKNKKLPTKVYSDLNSFLISRGDADLTEQEQGGALAASALLNTGKANIGVYNQGDNFQVWITDKEKPKDVHKFIMNENDVVRIFGGNYANDASAKAAIRLHVGNGNSNLTGDPLKSQFQKMYGYFRNVNKLNVTGDLQQLADGTYSYIVNVKKKDGRYQTFDLGGSSAQHRFSFNDADTFSRTLTDSQILSAIKQNYPNFDTNQFITNN